MRTASNALITFLNSNQQFIMVDLYTLTLRGGYIARYTSAETALTVNGVTFSPALVSRGLTKISVGLEVDTLDVTFIESPTDLLSGTPWLQAAHNGALDAALLTLERLYMPTYGDTSLGTITLFAGRVADVEISRTQAQLTIKSELELLDTLVPSRTFGSPCGNTLFDDGCAIAKASYAVVGTVAAGSTVSQINSALGQAADYFTLGTITFTSGVNLGINRSVRAFAGGAFTLALPLVTAPSTGDTFTAYPGCDRVNTTCSTKFNNLVNFAGFPFVPDPETAT